MERAVVALTLFVLAFDLPPVWFINSETEARGQVALASDGRTLAVFLVLYALSFTRLINNGDLVLDVLRRDRLLALFVAWISLSILWSNSPLLTTRKSGALLLTTLYAVFLLVRFSLKEILGLTTVAFAAGTIMSYLFVFALPSSGVSAGGWIGLFHNKNSLGRHEALAVVVYLVAAAAYRRWRVLLVVLALLSMFLIVRTTSATAMVGLLAVLGNYLVFRLFRARDTLFGAVAVSLTTTGLAAVAVAYGNLEFLARLLGKDITLTGRTELWSLVVQAISERPWLGWGWDAYWTGYYGPSHEVWVAAPWLPPHSHNAVLDYLLVIGIPGAALFLAMFVRGVVRSARYIRENADGTDLFPIMMLTYAFVFSLTEAGVVGRHARWVLVVVALFSVGESQSAVAHHTDQSPMRAEDDDREAPDTGLT